VLVITQHRPKCIGCHACVEAAPDRWQMSVKDGKATLLHGEEKRGGVHFLRVHEMEYEANRKAAEACPVKIIHLKLI